MRYMADKNSDIDYELITKYLAGEASAEESYVVTNWLETSATNKKTFAQLKLLWEQTGTIIPQETVDVDVDKAWKKFQSKVNIASEAETVVDKPEFASKSRSIYYFLSRAAAVLIIGISIYLFYLNRRAKPIEEIQIATTNTIKTDTLPDGSLVALNNYSRLSFPEKFNSHERPVSLKGEAYFEVTHNEEKPFSVKINGASITVLGTSFLIQAYDSLEFISVGVKEGSVMVTTNDSKIVLKAGESIAIHKDTKEINPVSTFNPNDLYWKSQTLIFQNEKLESVFKTLENHYHIDIIPENPTILNCRLTAKFYGENIDQIFEIINTNFNLNSNKEDNQFIISGSGCE